MDKYFNDFQFGVYISDGTKVILHSANRVLSQQHGDFFFGYAQDRFLECFQLGRQVRNVAQGEGEMYIYFFMG
jgi:hypothetical protein